MTTPTTGQAPPTDSRPWVYISSPYTKGDQALNVRFQCQVWDLLVQGGKVIPFAPLWSHFQHCLFPLPYEDWLAYDLALIPRFDACLRLPARLTHGPVYYSQHESKGADMEEGGFDRLGKPVYYSIASLLDAVDSGRLRGTMAQ